LRGPCGVLELRSLTAVRRIAADEGTSALLLQLMEL